MDATPGRPDRPDGLDRPDQYDRPRFREDLLAETIDDHGARFIDVMDPDSGNIFRFYEVEYSLACGMDGERDVAGIVKWAQDELGLTPSQHEVRAVIATLGDLGFINAVAAVAVAGRPELAPGEAAAPRSEPLPKAPSQPGVPEASARRPAEAPPSTNVELSAPAARQARPTPRPTPVAVPAQDASDSSTEISMEILTDGSTDGSTEVSIDLSDHVAVRPDDVKEAVRASKVMAAVDVPHGRFDTIDDRPEVKAPPMVSRPPEPARPAPAKPKSPTRPSIKLEQQVDAMPEAQIEVTHQSSAPRTEASVSRPPLTRQTENRAGKPAVELPRPPAPAEKSAVLPAPKARPSPVLFVVLIVAVLGGGAFLAWKYVLASPDTEVGTGSAPVEPVKPAVPVPPPAPPAPPAPASKIVMDAPAADNIKTSRAGQIETIVADKTPVKAGEPIVRLNGVKQAEADVANLTRDDQKIKDLIAAATKRRDQAQAAGNKAEEARATTEITDRQKVLSTKEDQLATRTTDLAKLMIQASADGTFTRVAKPGQKVAANDVVATLQRDAAPGATFAITDSTSFAINTSVELTVGKTAQHVTCTIADVQPDSVKVACPADPALEEGTDVTLKLPGAPAEVTEPKPPK